MIGLTGSPEVVGTGDRHAGEGEETGTELETHSAFVEMGAEALGYPSSFVARIR